MSSADAAQKERSLRQTIRSSLTAWATFALTSSGHTPARHHLMIMEALENLSRGNTQRLILLLPPGSAKSTYASQLFPAWWLAQHPRTSIVAACHTAKLAENFGRSVRGLLDEHSIRLGVKICGDSRAVGRFTTEHGGDYFAVGVNGAVTGRRADLALIDDPIRSFADAESFSAREHLWEWFRSELITRMKPGGRIVLIMTRWHHDDLAGRLIEAGGWDVLRLPALADQENDPLGRRLGEALWPKWEDDAAINEKRKLLGEKHFSALFQQSPLRDGGQIFDPRKLPLVDSVPVGVGVRAWDLAGTIDGTGDPDWTAGVKLIRDASGAVFIDDVIRFRGAPNQVAEYIRSSAAMDGPSVLIGLPQDPGQAGKSQVMFLTRMLAGFHVVATPETGAKAVRAMPVAAQISAGAVSMRRAGWNAMFLDELSSFPHGRKDDQVDALARAFSMLLTTREAAHFTRLPFSSR